MLPESGGPLNVTDFTFAPFICGTTVAVTVSDRPGARSIGIGETIEWETAARLAAACVDWTVDPRHGPRVLNLNVPNRVLSELRGVREAHLASYGTVWAGSAGTTCSKQKQRKRTPSKAGNEISRRWTICCPMRRQRTGEAKGNRFAARARELQSPPWQPRFVRRARTLIVKGILTWAGCGVTL